MLPLHTVFRVILLKAITLTSRLSHARFVMVYLMLLPINVVKENIISSTLKLGTY